MTELYLWELHSYLLILPFGHPDRVSFADVDETEDQVRDLWAQHLKEQASRGDKGVFPSDQTREAFGEFADVTHSGRANVYLAPGYWASEAAYRELRAEAVAAYEPAVSV